MAEEMIELDLPVVPENLMILNWEIVRKNTGYQYFKKEGKPVGYVMYGLHPLLLEWLNKNITTQKWYGVVLGQTLPNHLDRGGSLKLSYYDKLGGESVTTTFYETDRKTVKSTFIVKEKTWYLFKVDEFHGVEGIEAPLERHFLTTYITPYTEEFKPLDKDVKVNIPSFFHSNTLAG